MAILESQEIFTWPSKPYCRYKSAFLFREYVAQLIEYDKKFLIIGNQNNFTYKEIFKLVKEKEHLGRC